MHSFDHFRASPASAAIAIALLAAMGAQAQSAAPLQRYDLPRQPLASSIRAIAAASGKNVIAPGMLVKGRVAEELHGDFTPEDALAGVLAQSGLHAVSSGDTVTIALGDGRGDDTATDDTAIVVTGSHIRGAAPSSPVIALTSSDMAQSGKMDLGQVVRAIPQSFGGGQNPGIGGNVPVASGVDVSGASSINLRGLGSDATLTLLNGHRLAYNASRQSVDVSAIPIGAVDRIEVVADGASALYGSDAVAGVANILLKRDYDGLEAGARLAAATDGGAFQQQYHLTSGAVWGGGGGLVSYEYGNSTQILSDQRAYARSTSRGLTLFPPLRHHSAALSGHQKLTDNLTFTLDALFNVRWSHQDMPENAEGDPGISRGTFSSHDRSFGLAPSLELDLSGGWRASATGTFGREKVSYSQVLCDFEVCTGGGQGFYRNRERSAELDADGGLFRLPGGSAKLALGAGYRTIGFRRDNGPGSSVNTDHDQDSYYAFSEVNLPLVGPSQGLRWLYRVNASAALRYERYPGVGAVATPKMGLVIAPTADFDLKASWGRSFRAPTLYQQYQPNAVYVYAPLALGASAPPAGATALLIFGGNTNLRPERATSWSATIDLHPRVLAGSKISVSYFDVRYRDRIVTPITFVSQALSNPIYRDQVTPNPSAAVQQALIANAGAFANFAGVPYDPSRVIAIVNDGAVNAGSQKAHGIDILADYRWRVARAGEIRATANTSYLVSTQQLSASQPVTDLAGLLFNPPHWRGQGALSWISGPITLTGNVNYTGGVTDARQLLHAHVRSMTTFDLTGIYKATAGHGVLSGVNLIVSAQNLFNAKPDRIAIEGGYDAPYDSTNYSPVGRLLSIGIAKTW